MFKRDCVGILILFSIVLWLLLGLGIPLVLESVSHILEFLGVAPDG